MRHAGSIAVQDGEINEFELVLELVLFYDLMEQFGDMYRRIGEGTATEGSQNKRIVPIVHADAENGANLL